MKLNTKETNACIAVGKAFRSVGKDIYKIAPMVRTAIGKATGEKLELVKATIYNSIKADCLNDKGVPMSWGRIKTDLPEVWASYDAARQAVSRFIRSRDSEGRGPVAKLSAPQKAYNAAFDTKARLQKMEECPVDLIAAFDAAMAVAVRLGAAAKVAK